MWSFLETVRIECNWGSWCALVTLVKNDVPESFFVNFGATEPTPAQAAAAGVALALRKNVDEAPPGPSDTLLREEFFARFSNAEIAAIYAASAHNNDLFAYVKRMEITPSFSKTNPNAIAGLILLEAAGLLAPGRGAQILG